MRKRMNHWFVAHPPKRRVVGWALAQQCLVLLGQGPTYFIGMLLIFSAPTYAIDISALWKNAWHTKNQQGMMLMQQQHFSEAAKTFEDPKWQAAAAYRSGQYEKAAELYRQKNDVSAFYNLGNALAKSKHYHEAIKAYQQAIALNPHHQDALYNKQLIEDLLKQSPPQSPPPSSSNKNNDQQQNDPSSSQQDSSSQPNESKPSSSQPENTPPPQNQSDASPQKKPEQPNTPESPPESKEQPSSEQQQTATSTQSSQEAKQAKQQWLNLVPDHPGGLLRQQFLRDHLKRIRGTSS